MTKRGKLSIPRLARSGGVELRFNVNRELCGVSYKESVGDTTTFYGTDGAVLWKDVKNGGVTTRKNATGAVLWTEVTTSGVTTRTGPAGGLLWKEETFKGGKKRTGPAGEELWTQTTARGVTTRRYPGGRVTTRSRITKCGTVTTTSTRGVIKQHFTAAAQKMMFGVGAFATAASASAAFDYSVKVPGLVRHGCAILPAQLRQADALSCPRASRSAWSAAAPARAAAPSQTRWWRRQSSRASLSGSSR